MPPGFTNTVTSLDVQHAGSGTPSPLRVRESYAYPLDFERGGWGYPLGPYGSERPWFSATGTGSDRLNGRNLPQVFNELDLRGFRLIARDLDSRNQIAIGFLNLLVNYHVYKGFGWQACLRGAKKTPYAGRVNTDPLVEKAQRILDSWRDGIRWPLMSREAFRRWRRDGEVFGRWFRMGSEKMPAFRFVDPELIGSPAGDTSTELSFGIETDPDDVMSVWAYHQWKASDPTRGEWVPADEITHVKANVDCNVKRGIPDFLPLFEQVDGCRMLLRNMLASSNRQASKAWVAKYPGATAEQVRSIIPSIPSRPNAITAPASDPWAGYRGYGYVPPEAPGSIMNVEGDREFLPTPGGTGVPNYVEALQACLRACCMRWGMPEYATGDASNNNFASSLVAGAPFVKAVESTQYDWGAQWERPIALKVLDLAVDAGMLTRAERSRLDVEVTEPQVVGAEPDKEVQVLNTEHAAGVLSATTWQLKRGYDPQHEQANFDAERKRGMQPGPDGQQPGQQQPGQQQPGQQGGGELDALATKLKGGGSAESRVREVKDASGHEHGGDGKFTGTGGGGSGSRDDRQASRDSRREAATKAREHQDLNAPDVPGGWHEDLSAEDHEKELAGHLDAYDKHHAETRERLEAAGASDKELSEFDRRVSKNRADIARKAEKVRKAKAKRDAAEKALEDHRTALEAHEAAEPQEPDPEDEPEEPEEPEEPDGPEGYEGSPHVGEKPKREDYTDDADGDAAFAFETAEWDKYEARYAEYEKAHAEWEKDYADWEKESAAVAGRNEKAAADHDKAFAAWDKQHDRMLSKEGDLEDAHTEAGEDHDAAASEYEEEFSDSVAHNGEHVSETEDAIHDRIDDEEEADPEDEDEDEDDQEGGDSRESRTFPEDRAGLVKKQVTGKDGKPHTVYVRPDSGQSADEHPAKTDPPSADAVDLSGVSDDPGVVAKVKAKVGRVLTKLATLAYDAALASPQIIDAAGMLLDTPEDMAKLGYNPATAGTETQRVANPLQDAGIPLTPYQMTNLCTKVLPAAIAWVKGKLGGGKTEGSDIDALADLLAKMLSAVAEEFGMPEPPDAATIAANLRNL